MKNELFRDFYLLDNIPISSLELIKEACHYDEEFKARTIRFVFEARQILERLGHTVKENPET